MMRRSLLILAAGVLACAALGFLFHASRQRGTSMRDQLATLRQSAQPEPAAETDTVATTAEQSELAEWAALLEAARSVPEVARREAALRVIKRIQAEHAARPPAPKPLPPPVPRDGMYFAELLDDPEYLQLAAQHWRSVHGMHREQRLTRLGLPEAVRNQVIALEFDSYTAELEAQRYARRNASDRSAAMEVSHKVRAENTAALQQLLGDEAFAEYRKYTPAEDSQMRMPDVVLEPLATRLSYSSAPLDPATRTQLAELVQSMSPSTQMVHVTPHTPEFIERARGILSPTQVAALEELRAEREAFYARSRLPKSSELPRTKRRQRLEAGSN